MRFLSNICYYSRAAPPPRPPNAPQLRTKVPLLGGTIVIAIEEMGVKPSINNSKSKTSSSMAASTGSTLVPSQASASGAATLATSSSPITVHGVSIQHPPGRSHIERVLHELSVAGKMMRKARSAKDTTDSGHAIKTEPITTMTTSHAPKDSASTPRTRNDSASTPRPRKNSVSTPRPTSSGLTQTQSSSLSILTNSLTQPDPVPQPSPQMSDNIERLYISVSWTPEPNALGFVTNPAEWVCKIDVVSVSFPFSGLQIGFSMCIYIYIFQ